MEGTVYCGSKSSFSIRGMLFKPGVALTKKALSCISSRNLKRFLDDGTLTVDNPAFLQSIEEFPEPPAGNRLNPVKKWNVDPLLLVGKDLQQLNIMILERDPTTTPFETIEEAAAQLTRDFKVLKHG